MEASPSARLATLLGCAPQGLPTPSALSAAEQEQLCTAIERSLRQHEKAMTASLPEFLRPLLIALRSRRP